MVFYEYGENYKYIDTTKQANSVPALVKKIGKTTYRVHIHFSTASTETMIQIALAW